VLKRQNLGYWLLAEHTVNLVILGTKADKSRSECSGICYSDWYGWGTITGHLQSHWRRNIILTQSRPTYFPWKHFPF